jgi:putative tricarboxylic transport membrane protein
VTTGRSLRIGESVLGGGVLALGLFIAFETSQLEIASSHATVGPRLFPFLVATGLIIVGAALLREAVFGHIAHEGGFELDWLAVGLVSVGLIVEMLLLEWAGWIVAATLLFVLVARAFGSRRLLIDAAIGVVLTALTFVVFSYGLDLTLPAGTIAERYLAPEDEEDEAEPAPPEGGAGQNTPQIR